MGSQVERYISAQAGMNLGKVFDQYLRSVMIPTFEYRIEHDTLSYRWSNVVPGFDMPVRVTLAAPAYALIHPTTSWQQVKVKLTSATDFKVDENFYVIPKPVER